jgi:hypothetical protein
MDSITKIKPNFQWNHSQQRSFLMVSSSFIRSSPTIFWIILHLIDFPLKASIGIRLICRKWHASFHNFIHRFHSNFFLQIFVPYLFLHVQLPKHCHLYYTYLQILLEFNCPIFSSVEHWWSCDPPTVEHSFEISSFYPHTMRLMYDIPITS